MSQLGDSLTNDFICACFDLHDRMWESRSALCYTSFRSHFTLLEPTKDNSYRVMKIFHGELSSCYTIL